MKRNRKHLIAILVKTAICFAFVLSLGTTKLYANSHLSLPKILTMKSSHSFGSGDSCMDMLEQIVINDDVVREDPLKMYRRILSHANISWSMHNEYLHDLMNIGLTNLELNTFARFAKIQVKSEDDVLRILNALRFAKNLEEKDVVPAIREIFTKIAEEPENMSATKYWLKSQGFSYYSNFLSFEQKMKRWELMNFITRNVTTPKGSTDDMLKATRLWRLKQERKYLACRSPNKTPEQKEAFFKFGILQSIFGVGLYTGIYTAKEFDRLWDLHEEDHSFWALKEVGREFAQSSLSTASIMYAFRKSSATGLKKWKKLYIAYALTGLFDPLVLNKGSDEYVNKAQDFIDAMSKDPDFEEQLRTLQMRVEKQFDLVNPQEDLKRILKNDVAREDFLALIDDYIKSSNLSEQDKDKFTKRAREEVPYIFDRQDQRVSEWVEQGELSDEQILEEFQFIMATYYYEQIEGLIHTGDVGWDRFSYSRFWTIPSVAKDIWMGQIIYDMLCVFGLNQRTMSLAMALHVANISLTSSWFVDSRNYALNEPREETHALFNKPLTYIEDKFEQFMNSETMENFRDFQRKATTIVTEAP